MPTQQWFLIRIFWNDDEKLKAVATYSASDFIATIYCASLQMYRRLDDNERILGVPPPSCLPTSKLSTSATDKGKLAKNVSNINSNDDGETDLDSDGVIDDSDVEYRIGEPKIYEYFSKMRVKSSAHNLQRASVSERTPRRVPASGNGRKMTGTVHRYKDILDVSWG